MKIRHIILSLTAAIAIVLLVVLGNTLMLSRPPSVVSHKMETRDVVNENELAQKLSEAIQLETVSQKSSFDSRWFLAFHQLLQRQFPVVHQQASRELVNEYSLLYRFKGKKRNLNPVLLLAHYDVVPVSDLQGWSVAPFSGLIKDGYVWGRGAMDDKGAVVSIMQALENLLSQGYGFERDVYLALGHDEETGGLEGAVQMAAVLKKRNLTLDYILDEGGMITQNIIPGVEKPVALIGLAEKGYASFQLSVKASGGHSSVPPRSTAIGQLSQVISAIELNPVQAKLKPPVSTMFEALTPHMPWMQRMAFSNLWLFEPLLLDRLSESPGTNAAIRSTYATTVFHAGQADNVLPGSARAIVNVRMLPGDSSEVVQQHLEVLSEAFDIKIEPFGRIIEASNVSSARSQSYKNIQTSILAIDPNIVVVPSLSVAGTDSKHFRDLSKNIYRFRYNTVHKTDIKRYHGIDERVSIGQLKQAVLFYMNLLRAH